jgi:hypothetical protein
MPGLVLIVAFSIVLIAQIRSTSLDLKEGDPSNTLSTSKKEVEDVDWV